MPSQDSACSLEQALKCNDGQITPLEFIQSCLRHLGPLNTRVHHREDDEPLEDQICKKLWYRKPYGPIAAALRLCERDNLAEQIDDTVAPVFAKCVSNAATVRSVRSAFARNSVFSFNQLVKSPLFCQAMIVAALQSDNVSLAKELVSLHGPDAPPPEKLCCFTMRYTSMNDEYEFGIDLWTALIRARWIKPSPKMCYLAAKSLTTSDGIAFFDTVKASESSRVLQWPTVKARLPGDALCEGTPEILQYIWTMYDITPRLEDDMVIQSIEWRDEGGVEMLKYLLDQGLDANYMRKESLPNDIGPTDPRDRAEQEMARGLLGLFSTKTALLAAAGRGNGEAVEYLLQRGANPKIADGSKQTPYAIATKNGFSDVAAVIKSHKTGKRRG